MTNLGSEPMKGRGEKMNIKSKDGVEFDRFLEVRLADMKAQLSRATNRAERAFWIGRINAFQSIEVIWLNKPQRCFTLGDDL